MKISASSLANLHRTLGALIVSVSASLAQNPVPPPPVAPSAFAPIDPPISAPGRTVPGGPLAPAPIEPPIQNPGGAPAGVPDGIPAAGDPSAVPGIAPGIGTIDMSGSRVSEFQGDDISLVLRTLARQAKMNVVVSPAVQGQVTLRVENRTPAEVIRIICQSNGLVVDELEGVSYIKTQAEKQKEPTESLHFTFSYGQSKDIAPLVKTQFGLTEPQVDIRTNTVFLQVGKSNKDAVLRFLELIDSPTKQVMIEARLVEVTANPNQSYGLNWAGVVGSASTPQTFKLGGTDLNPGAVPVGSTVAGGGFQTKDFLRQAQNFSALGSSVAGQYAILSASQMTLTMRLLNEDNDAQFLANPRIVAANNQKAVIKVTRNQPVPQLNFNEQTAQAVFGGFQDKEFGNTLTVTPSINKDQYVTMTVQPVISNKVGDATFTFSGATVSSPIIDTRSFDSNVLIRSGDTLAIGGLLQDESLKARNKVPLLGDIPGLGYLFSERINSRSKRNLLVFVTPTIIKQGYATGLECQVAGLKDSGPIYADPTGWRNNARGAYQIVPTSDRQNAADYRWPAASPSRSSAGATHKANEPYCEEKASSGKSTVSLRYRVSATTRE